MDKKSTSKLRKFLNKKLIQKSKVILLGIVIASLFLPFFGANKALSQSPRGPIVGSPAALINNCKDFDPTKPETFSSRVYVDKTDTNSGLADRSYAIGKANVNGPKTQTLKLGESLFVYIEADLPPGFLGCANDLKDQLKFQIHVYDGGGDDEGRRYTASANFDSSKNKWFASFTLTEWYIAAVNSNFVTIFFCLKSGCNWTDGNGNDYIERFQVVAEESPSRAATIIQPTSPLLQGVAIESDKQVELNKIRIKIVKKDGGDEGFRNKYRVALDDSSIDLIINHIYVDWGNEVRLGIGQPIVLPNDSDTNGIEGTPEFYGVFVGATFADNQNNKCKYAFATLPDCTGVFFGPNPARSGPQSDRTTKVIEALPNTNNALSLRITESDILSKVGSRQELSSKQVEGSKPVGAGKFKLLPGIYAFGQKPVYIFTGSVPAEFAIEVFKTKQGVIDACKAEGGGDEFCNNYENASTRIGEIIEVNSGTDQKAAESTLDALFDLVVKVVGYLVYLLTSFIFWVFGTIILPILTALTKIHPYTDDFVDFVYPGWVIIRNLSNITFIIALLYMGLKILFQQEDSGKTRGFIVNLILMALLINFSLVIMQSVVAIADTVQAQFLPENSKVIESLAQKLMVDPIVTFRGGKEFSAENQTPKTYASDLPRVLTLFVLCVAAFFSFVALVAFMFIRLVALWLLYMLSPLAYAGRILPETKSAADKYWSNLFTYAFNVPILALFLNIAALMAVTFSAQEKGQLIKPGARGFLMTGEGIVEFAATSASHILVLVFIYFGMIYAQKFGGYGADKIVSYAKKGFDAVARKAPMAVGGWAKDTVADWGAEKLKARGNTGLATALRATARPVEALKAFKKGYFDKPKEQMNKRFADDFEDRAKKLQPWGEDKLFPLKWAAWQLMGEGGGRLAGQVKDLQEKASILNDSERDELKSEFNTATSSKKDNSDKLTGLSSGQMDTVDGRKYADQMQEKIKGLTSEIEDLDDQMVDAKPNAKRRLTDQKNAKLAELKSLNASYQRLDDSVGLAEKAGRNSFDFTGIVADLEPVVDVKKLEKDLREAVSNADTKISQTSSKLAADDALRGKYGVTKMDDDTRKDILAEASKLAELANKHSRPYSKSKEAEDAGEVAKAKKEIAELELDYGQLESGLEEALKRNNMIQARAFAKQIAEIGKMDTFLRDRGYKYNVKGLEKFVEDKFKGGSRTNISIIREISKVAEKNGNLPLAYAVKGLPDGGGIIKGYDQQIKEVMKKIQKSSAKDLKLSDIQHDDLDGRISTIPKLEEWARYNNSPEKAKVAERDINPEVAQAIHKHILQMGLAQELSHITEALDRAKTKS